MYLLRLNSNGHFFLAFQINQKWQFQGNACFQNVVWIKICFFANVTKTHNLFWDYLKKYLDKVTRPLWAFLVHVWVKLPELSRAVQCI